VSAVLPGCRGHRPRCGDFEIKVVAPRLDFINAARIVLGGNNQSALLKVYNLYRTVFTHTKLYACTWEEAEMVKYMANCFFALKLSYLNEIFVMCKKPVVNFSTVKKNVSFRWPHREFAP